WLSINTASYQGFRNSQGEAAVIYPIAFSTQGGAPTLTAAQNRNAIAALKTAIDRNYSYRDRLKVDWNKQFTNFSPKLESAQTPHQFAILAAQMLAPAQDKHLWVKYKSVIVPTDKRQAEQNFNFETMQKQVPSWKQKSTCVFTGQFDGGIAYILITSWNL